MLSYSSGAGDDTHKLFQGAVERFLKRRPVQIGRLPSVTCAQGHVQERAAVRKAITDGRPFFYCDICGAKLSTSRIDDIGMPTPRHAAAVLEAEETADRRTSYEVALAWVKAFRRDRGNADKKPSCFISYAWGDPGHERWVEQLADRLQNADVLVTLDKWHNPPGAAVSRFIERIAVSDFVCSVGTPLYLRKDQTQNTDPVVQAELRLIKSKLMKRDGVHDTVIPLLREGTSQEAFPPLLQDSVFIDFRVETDFFVRLFDLILTIHRVPFDNEMSRQHRDELVGESGRKSSTGFAKHQMQVSLSGG